ncbi:hypothetical protein ACP4OV_014230 [Aristida adscensionis]
MGAAAVDRCELCEAPAAVHCEADAAYLCAACDARVHGANFLASRHRRTRLAAAAGCDMDTASAEEGDEDEYESSAASSCVSTADSAATAAAARTRTRPRPAGPGRGARAEAVLEEWAKRMGLAAGDARGRAAAAARALRACGGPRVLPPRVAMAAALWSEAAAAAGRGEALRRLEACAHVPARLVVAVASSMARARARRRRPPRPAVEGWDECSWAGPKSSQARS